MIEPVIYNNLKEFIPQEGVTYKCRYEDFLKDERVAADALLYFEQKKHNSYDHLNNAYLAKVRDYILNDSFFLLYFGRSYTEPVNHHFMVQTCANSDFDIQLYESNLCFNFLEERARGHLKTAENENIATTLILRHPEDSLLFVSANKPFAERSVFVVMQILEMNEIKHAFSDVLYENPKDSGCWNKDKGALVKRKRLAKEVSLEYCGLYDSMKTGGHYRFIIFDDIMTPDYADSPKERKKGRDNFDMAGNLTFKGHTLYQSMLRVTGTPYHSEDVINYVRNKKDTKDKPLFKARRIRQANDDDVPIFVTDIEHQLSKSSASYPSQQQLDTSAKPEDKLHFSDIVITDFVPKNLLEVIIVDPAGDKDLKHAKDNWAIGHFGVELSRDKYGAYNIHILDLILRQMKEEEAPGVITNMYRNNRHVQAIAIEQQGPGYLARRVTEMVLAATGVQLSENDDSLILLKPTARGNKKLHIARSLAYPLKNHKIFMQTAIKEIYKRQLKHEINGFPEVSQDGGPDILAYLNIVLDKMNFQYKILLNEVTEPEKKRCVITDGRSPNAWMGN